MSDDSDEMYAAILDTNNQADLYTSGSETYAQIQPPNQMTVSVEINVAQPTNEATTAAAIEATTSTTGKFLLRSN